MLRPGGDVDSWCGKCKMILAHTIEAMVGDKPVRVQCNTCRSQHGYKANKPAESKRARAGAAAGAAGAAPSRRRANQYEDLMEGKNMALARRYSPQEKFDPGDVVDHPTFGVGIAKNLKGDTKVEILFKDGLKLLIHGR